MNDNGSRVKNTVISSISRPKGFIRYAQFHTFGLSEDLEQIQIANAWLSLIKEVWPVTVATGNVVKIYCKGIILISV